MLQEGWTRSESCLTSWSLYTNHSNSVSFTSYWLWHGYAMMFNTMRGTRSLLGAVTSLLLPSFSHEGNAKRVTETQSPDRTVLLNKLILEWPNLWTACTVITCPCWLNHFLLGFLLLRATSINNRVPNPEWPTNRPGRNLSCGLRQLRGYTNQTACSGIWTEKYTEDNEMYSRI